MVVTRPLEGNQKKTLFPTLRAWFEVNSPSASAFDIAEQRSSDVLSPRVRRPGFAWGIAGGITPSFGFCAFLRRVIVFGGKLSRL